MLKNNDIFPIWVNNALICTINAILFSILKIQQLKFTKKKNNNKSKICFIPIIHSTVTPFFPNHTSTNIYKHFQNHRGKKKNHKK